MSILDILIAITVLIGVYRGFVAGMIKTVMALISWLVALVAASKLAADFQSLFAPFVDSAILQLALAFVFVFLVVLCILRIIVWFFNKAFRALKLDIVNKLAGGVLGGGVGLLKVLVALSVAAPLLVRLPVWQTSPLAQSLLPFAPIAKTLVYEAAGEVMDVVDKDLPKNTL